MSVRFLSFFILPVWLALATAPTAAGNGNNPVTGSKPVWVKDKVPALKTDSLTSEKYGSSCYLLVDVQENIAVRSTYVHYAIKLINNEGVQNNSDISIDYDPASQKLVIHEINIYRDGKKTDELRLNKIKTIQRETEMDRFFYDGTITAYMNLRDVREGDILEYSYTVTGYDSVLNGNFCKTFYMEYSVPVLDLYKSIIVPKTRNIYFGYPSGKAEPEKQDTGDAVRYEWERKNVKARRIENNVPAWYNGNLRVEASTIGTWKEVVDLFKENYRVPESEMTELRKRTAGLFGDAGGDSVITPVIRFVQDKIRYLAFEEGMDGHRPASPLTVLDTRYGDCKAKTLLICSLLRLNGIEANPVLVNSEGINSDTVHIPSGNIFNHVIVQVRYRNLYFYVDPTISNQGGVPGNIYFPDYGYGLVLKDGTKGLLRLANFAVSKTAIKDYYRVDSIGGPATLRVQTEYTGEYADDIRSTFKSSTSEEITKSYLKFYSSIYPFIRSASPIKFNDLRDSNVVAVEEKYIIDSCWVKETDEKGVLYFRTKAGVISGILQSPPSPGREMPYSLTYPADFTEDIFIDLPIEWAVKPESTEISDSSFYFLYRSHWSTNQIHLEYRYKTFTDNVPPSAYSRFYTKYKAISDNLSYRLRHAAGTDKGPFRLSWPAIFLLIIILCAATFFSVKIYRYWNLPVTPSAGREIGGWLVLIEIGLFISTLVVLYQIFFKSAYLDRNTWQILFKDPDNGLAIFLLILFEFIYNTLFLVYLVLVQVMFYRKRNIVPRLIIVLYAVSTFFLLVDTLAAFVLMPDRYSNANKAKTVLSVIFNIISSAIWITYFLKSKRVRETFTRPAPSAVYLTDEGENPVAGTVVREAGK